MSSRDTVGFAVIGCGTAAWIGHLPWIWGHPRTRLIAVCDRKLDRAIEARERWQAQLATVDPVEAMKRGDVQAVCICTPPATHLDLARHAARLGKHVLIEKPMGRTVEECESVISTADRHGTLVVPGHEKRFHMAAGKIREIIAAGALGKVFHLTVHWGASVKLAPEQLIPAGYRDGYFWRWQDPDNGGGVLQDHLPHYVDLWRWWIGSEVESVCAEAQYISRDYLNRPEIGRWEDYGSVLMRFANGAVGTFHTGTVGGRALANSPQWLRSRRMVRVWLHPRYPRPDRVRFSALGFAGAWPHHGLVPRTKGTGLPWLVSSGIARPKALARRAATPPPMNPTCFTAKSMASFKPYSTGGRQP